jgi:hypothetical protein
MAKEHKQLEYPFDKRLEAEINGNPQATVVKLNGEQVQHLREITVTSDMDMDTVTLEILHLPSTQSIRVDGYLISERDFDYLQAARRAGFRP